MPDNPYNRRKRGAVKGLKAESKTAKRMGGRTTPGSGAKAGHKADIVLEQFLLENKCTSNASMGVKLEWLKKICHEALGKNKLPALSIQFVDMQGTPVKNGKWVCIPEHVFTYLTERDE